MKALGHPLLVGDEFMDLSLDDVMLRWIPRKLVEYVTIAHPVPGTPEPDLAIPAELGGYTMAHTPFGPVVGDDKVNPFLAVMSTITQSRWHLDIRNTLGIPAVDNGILFTGLGGEGARRAIAALDPDNGTVLWKYAPR